MPRKLLFVSIAVLVLSSLGLWQLVLQRNVPPALRGIQSRKAATSTEIQLRPRDMTVSRVANASNSVTFTVAPHEASLVHIPRTVKSVEQVLAQTWETSTRNEEWNEKNKTMKWTRMKCKELLQSSLSDDAETLEMYMPLSNGFVDGVMKAYNEHLNLVIRPDDTRIAILSQLNLYINAHAEEFRDKFVSHQDKKTLKIEVFGDRHNFDYAWMANKFADMFKENVQIKDTKFHEMIMPTFSTTTDTDKVVASALMMSTLKKYFNYVVSFLCGIPSITILGTRDDYSAILTRLSTLDSLNLGSEPLTFTTMLRPIIHQFVSAASQKPTALDIDAFWSRICQPTGGGSGPSYLGGWISAFSAWNSKGRWQGGQLELVSAPLTPNEKIQFKLQAGRVADPENIRMFEMPPPLVYEGVRYPVIHLGAVANGFGDVEIRIEEANGEVFDAMLVAGHVGVMVKEWKFPERKEEDAYRWGDTIQPSPQWFMFVKEKVERKLGEYDKYD